MIFTIYFLHIKEHIHIYWFGSRNIQTKVHTDLERQHLSCKFYIGRKLNIGGSGTFFLFFLEVTVNIWNRKLTWKTFFG